MKTKKALTISKTIEKKDIRRFKIMTDSLYKRYDFCNDDFKELLIDHQEIISLKNKEIYDYWTKKTIYQHILQIAEEYELYYDNNSKYNFYVGEKFNIGNNMKIIKENINDYKEYLNNLDEGYITLTEIKLN